MNQAAGARKSPDSSHSQDVAGVGGAPHLEALPCRSSFQDPGGQISGRGAGHGDFISAVNGSPDEVTHADGHAVHRGLRDDQDAAGS